MRTSVALAAAALVALAVAAPAQAEPARREPAPPRGLFLTVSGDENTWIRGVLLECPAGSPSHHPEAGAACEALDGAGGDLTRLAGHTHPCTREFAPVTVAAAGTWHGRPVDWHRTYPNACMLYEATGPVFRF
jgi:hypothetical protein